MPLDVDSGAPDVVFGAVPEGTNVPPETALEASAAPASTAASTASAALGADEGAGCPLAETGAAETEAAGDTCSEAADGGGEASGRNSISARPPPSSTAIKPAPPMIKPVREGEGAPGAPAKGAGDTTETVLLDEGEFTPKAGPG